MKTIKNIVWVCLLVSGLVFGATAARAVTMTNAPVSSDFQDSVETAKTVGESSVTTLPAPTEPDLRGLDTGPTSRPTSAVVQPSVTAEVLPPAPGVVPMPVGVSVTDSGSAGAVSGSAMPMMVRVTVDESGERPVLRVSDDSVVSTSVPVVGEVKIENDKILFGAEETEIKILPAAATTRAVEALSATPEEIKIELKESAISTAVATPVYEAVKVREVKILGLFRAKLAERVEIDAETGEASAVKRPWWRFLVF